MQLAIASRRDARDQDARLRVAAAARSRGGRRAPAARAPGSTRSPIWAGGAIDLRTAAARLLVPHAASARRRRRCARRSPTRHATAALARRRRARARRGQDQAHGRVLGGARPRGQRADRARRRRTRRSSAPRATSPHVKVLRAAGLNVYDVLAPPAPGHHARRRSSSCADRREADGMNAHPTSSAAPLITEKGTLVNELGNQVVFRVAPRREQGRDPPGRRDALQGEGRRRSAPSTLLGKTRRVGRIVGRRLGLEEGLRDPRRGQRIDFFEGA